MIYHQGMNKCGLHSSCAIPRFAFADFVSKEQKKKGRMSAVGTAIKELCRFRFFKVVRIVVYMYIAFLYMYAYIFFYVEELHNLARMNNVSFGGNKITL